MPVSYPVRRRLPRRRVLAALAAAALTAAGLTGCSGEDGPEQSVDAFLKGWRSGNLQAVGFVDPAGTRVPATDVAKEIKALSGELAATPPELKRAGDAKVTADAATARIQVTWTLPGQTRWTYESPVRLKRGDDDQWQMIWEPAVVQEKLEKGDRLALRRDTAPRAGVLDGAGSPIVAPRPVVRVGVQPGEAGDVKALVRQLDAAFKAIRPALVPPVDLTDLPKRLTEAEPGAFVEVVTLRDEAYRQIKPRIYDLPGTKFQSDKLDLAPTREFARALLGSVDPAQADDIQAHPDKYVAGDLVGHGGLQGRYDDRLRGVPGLTVVTEHSAPDGSTTPGTEVFRSEPKAGQSLKTTLDVATQNAADAALRGEARRAALVAVRISDGAVLAAANGPGPAGENLAFTAQVPPGSTFKMVSALALLDKGAVTPSATVACPKTAVVDGRPFKNSDDFELGSVPFTTDFAKSCNTAFVALAPKLGPDGLATTGRTLGLEAKWDLGAEVFAGSVSANGSATEQAAAAIGQGTTVVSPLAMAGATAAVARGRWEQPTLVLDPAPQQAAPAGPALKPESVAALKTMMRAVVTSGTASALKDVPGEPVYGKTGTAEYDNNPAHTHAWFVGWQGDVAFAVFVEQGGASTASAVPISERFLRALAAR
ncbi:penicillin-binding transpeptidase domain-containing protein [Micromonospora narathiwatensis]|uniref:Cell division protein FtsI/penicillin-binding protein 2 n=1 Tax=Micromonospora narathiwatensis TaxID=299146 RepID=A0A1A9A247_9ACTN|nr:penicillin-binding transpeptidase domain-containing protein [Micromonospora narathiwatensis]SBT50264.1 Cell division protein FtsI/penicillin-binding protein 2 [Micromonospora narathiwatensis]